MSTRPQRIQLIGVVTCCLLSWLSTPAVTQDHEPTKIVHEPGDIIEFNSFCAKREPYSLSEYALVKSLDRSARAILDVTFTHRAGRSQDVIMYVAPQIIKLNLGPSHADQDISFQLVVEKADQRIESHTVDTFVENTTGESGSLVKFRTDELGDFDWISFTEPVKKRDSERTHRFFNKDLYIVAEEDLGDVAVSLRATVGNGDASIDLVGPQVRVPQQLWAKKPKSQVMGLAQTLNPFNKGSVWRFLSRAAKFRNCIDERRFAKSYLSDSPV